MAKAIGNVFTSKTARHILDRYRITKGHGFKLKDHDPGDKGGLPLTHEDGNALLQQGVGRLSELQALLYADNRYALLCCLQAMDTAGKDGTINHVMSGVNPQGVRVTSFKAPGPHEKVHDFLWRISAALPARGQIGIFNRSQYEDVLVARVHPELLGKDTKPGHKFWARRLEAISAFEDHLAREGTIILKFFLNISRAEQKRRLIARLDDPSKHWKFDTHDIAERDYWDDYQNAYQEAIAATATQRAPWFVVPGNHKWFARLVVVAALIEALEKLDLRYPDADASGIADARAKLEAEPD